METMHAADGLMIIQQPFITLALILSRKRATLQVEGASHQHLTGRTLPQKSEKCSSTLGRVNLGPFKALLPSPTGVYKVLITHLYQRLMDLLPQYQGTKLDVQCPLIVHSRLDAPPIFPKYVLLNML